jgi:hypothetical protein
MSWCGRDFKSAQWLGKRYNITGSCWAKRFEIPLAVSFFIDIMGWPIYIKVAGRRFLR